MCGSNADAMSARGLRELHIEVELSACSLSRLLV